MPIVARSMQNLSANVTWSLLSMQLTVQGGGQKEG